MLKHLTSFLIVTLGLLSVCQTLSADVETRRGIEVHYNYKHIQDGFGNIRRLTVEGFVKNTTENDASRVNIVFKMYWAHRNSIQKKFRVKNISSQGIKDFQFEIDLGSRPDVLNSIEVDISNIKYSTKRQVSPPSAHDIKTNRVLSLPHLDSEGHAFQAIFDDMKKAHIFKTPPQDEFETTDELEVRVNELENKHFSVLMDKLEHRYGEFIAGKGAIVRFIPSSVQGKLIYLAENSIQFDVPIRFGRYDADAGHFQDVNLLPRTVSFKPNTVVPSAPLEISHESGYFFLRKPFFDIPRAEARKWRRQEQFIVVSMLVRLGVIQDGPFPEPFCIVEKLSLKNIDSEETFREWGWLR